MSLLLRCDLPLSGLSGCLSLELSLWHSAASFSDVADLSDATAV